MFGGGALNGMQTSGVTRKESFELDGDAVVETCVVGGFVPDTPKGVEGARIYTHACSRARECVMQLHAMPISNKKL